MQNDFRPTRGTGFLEKFLAGKRAKIANQLISGKLRNGKILDIGCGVYPFFLKNTVFSGKYGIDKNFSTVQDKEINLEKVNIENEKLPYVDNFFDTVVMLASIEHFKKENIEDILKEIYRALKKEGILVITTPTPIGNRILRLLALLNLVSKEEINDHKCSFSKEDMLNYLKTAGFSYANFKYGFFEFKLNSWFLIKK